MIVTIDLDNKAFDYIDTCDKTLTYISFNHHNIRSTSSQYVYGRYMLFKIVPVVDWRVITVRKHQKVHVYSVHKRSKQVRFDYSIVYVVYTDKPGIYHKLDYKTWTA